MLRRPCDTQQSVFLLTQDGALINAPLDYNWLDLNKKPICFYCCREADVVVTGFYPQCSDRTAIKRQV